MLIVSFFHANLEKVTIEAVACVSGKIIGLTDIDLNFFVYCMKQETRFIFGPFIFEFRFSGTRLPFSYFCFLLLACAHHSCEPTDRCLSVHPRCNSNWSAIEAASVKDASNTKYAFTRFKNVPKQAEESTGFRSYVKHRVKIEFVSRSPLQI